MTNGASSYQGYQQGGGGGGGAKSRRREYEDLGGGSDSSHNNGYSSHNTNQPPPAQARMETMEILSGREYGNEFESEGGGNGVMKNRWTIYASVGLLLLIVLIAPHRDDSASNSNFKLPKNSSSSINNATDANANVADSAKTTPSAQPMSVDPSSQSPALSPTTPASASSSSSTPSFATTCDLPPSVKRDSSNFTYLDRTNFCLAEPTSQETCQCLNPVLPVVPAYSHEPPRTNDRLGWNDTHLMNIRLLNQSLAALAEESEQQQQQPLDIVFLGDSITEHWNGRDMGTFREKDYNVSLVFQELFQKQNGSRVEGLALGIAGDRCQNLLYRLQHGEMPPRLNPKVWWLLIGTNDLGSDLCSGDSIMVGNIRIVEEIRRRYPQTPIVINSLLPRERPELLRHNRMWTISSQINHRLECYAKTQPNVEFFNATSLFVYEDFQNEDEYGVEVYLNETLMHDYVHPSGEGALLWGQRIVDRVLNLTKAESRQ